MPDNEHDILSRVFLAVHPRMHNTLRSRLLRFRFPLILGHDTDKTSVLCVSRYSIASEDANRHHDTEKTIKLFVS